MDLSNREGRRKQGARIKRAAREAGLSLDELAVRISCSRALIYQYASGAHLAQSDRLQTIGTVVGKPLAYFFTDDDAEAAETADDSVLSDRTSEASWIRERIANLRRLLDAYANPPDPRQIADICQQLVTLAEHEVDSQTIAEILFKQANALMQIQDFGGAKAKFQEAGALFRQSNRIDFALSCVQSLGHVNVQLGRTEEAIKQFEEVSLGSAWRHRWQGALSMGAAYEVLGNYAASAEMFLHATEIVEENANSTETDLPTLYIESNWANLDLDWGEYDSAADRADKCVALAQRLGVQDQYVEAKLTRSIALLGLYDVKAAIPAAQTARNVAQLLQDYPRCSLALSCCSLCLSAILKPHEAIADAKEALTIALRYGANRAEMFAQQALVEAYLTAGNYSEARYHLDEAMSAARSHGLRLQQAQFAAMRGRLAIETGNIDEAYESARDALTIAEDLEAKPVLIDACLILARAALTLKNWDEAKSHAETAFTLATKSHAPVQRWIACWHLANAQVHVGDAVAARTSLEIAFGQLFECRRQFREATGTDRYMETSAAANLLREGMAAFEQILETEEANDRTDPTDWPATQQWLKLQSNELPEDTKNAQC